MKPSERTRRIAPPVLAVVAAVSLIAALVTGYAWRTLSDSEQFANRAVVALDDEAVSEEAARRVAGELVSAEPDLTALRPVIEGVVSEIVGGGAFQAAFRAGVADLHRATFKRDQDTVTLTLADIGATVRGALAALRPKLGNEVPARADIDLLDVDPPSVPASLIRFVDAWWLAPALLLIGLLSAAVSLRLAPDSRRAARTLGVIVVLGAVLAVVVFRVLEVVLLTTFESEGARDAVAGIWNAYLGDLRTALLLLALCGAVFAAAASSLLRPLDFRGLLERALSFIDRVPERRGRRAVRALALLAVGILIVVRSADFVTLVAIVFGLLVVFAGVNELMHLTMAGPADAPAERRSGRATLVAAIVTAAAILIAAAIFISVGGLSERSLAVDTEGCNGSDALCEQPLDELAIPATHNSMSAASQRGWLFAQQERGIADQLRDGIRGLFIDAHYGVETKDGTIKTDLGEIDRGERARYERELGTAAFEAALRIRDRVVKSAEVGPPGVYLCHRFCELGALSIDKAFGQVRDFIAANPSEALVVVIEDYVAPREIAAAADRTGLIDYVYTGAVGSPWPSLQEMIDSGGRVLILAENRSDESIPWYHPAYEDLLQETPFTFKRPSQLIDRAELDASCKRNRGPADASLFLINHWIDTSPAAKPSNAAEVNSREALLRRVERCEHDRAQPANLISVDFYREGDLFGVVEELNSDRLP